MPEPIAIPEWASSLPDELKNDPALASYKTVGDLAKAHVETSTKFKELETRSAGSIAKLPENATPEQRNAFFNSLGRPEKPEQYRLAGGDEAMEKALGSWKQDFHELGLTSQQAEGLKAKFDGRINALVDQHNANILKMNSDAEAALKAEWGDKFPAISELVKRMWKANTDSELDKVFEGESSANRVQIMRFIFKMAEKTGEDRSLRAGGSIMPNPGSFINYDKSPAPPRRN